MPKLTQEALKWFYEFQGILQRDFDADSRNPADLGRVQVITNIDFVEDGDDSTRVIRPLKLGESTDYQNENLAYSVKYAFAPLDVNTGEYSQNFNTGNPKELLDAQKGFHVEVDEHGVYTMESELSEDQLMYLYENAKDLRLYVNGHNSNIASNSTNGKSAFITAGKNNEAVKLSSSFNSAAELTGEQLDQLLAKHPEFNGLNSDGEPYYLDSYDVCHASEIEFGEYSKTADPDFMRKRYLGFVDGLQQTVNNSDDISEIKYYNAFWDKKNSIEDYKTYVSFEDWRLCCTGLEDYFSSNFMEFSIAGNVGLDRLFYYDEKDMQLCPLLNRIPGKLSGKEQQDEIMHKIADLNKAGNLYAYVQKETGEGPALPDAPKKEQLYKLSYQNNTVRGSIPSIPNPDKPGFIKTLLHKLRPSWFKDDFERYEKAKFKKEYFDYRLSNPPAGGFIDPRKAKTEQGAQQAASQQKKLTREDLEQKIAKGITDAQKTLPIGDYLKCRSLTKEGILGSTAFKEYLALPNVQEQLEKKLQGDNSISTSAFCRGFLEHIKQIENKAQQAGPQKNPVNREAVRNDSIKTAEAQNTGAVLKS